MKVLKTEGSTKNYLNQMIAFEEFNKLIGLPEIRKFEEKYSTGRDCSNIPDGR
jgi:hypothetical protein